MSDEDWQPLETAPKPKPGETWGRPFLVGRWRMPESIGIARYQSCLLEPQSFVLEVAGLHLRAHEDLPFTHWQELPFGPGCNPFGAASRLFHAEPPP